MVDDAQRNPPVENDEQLSAEELIAKFEAARKADVDIAEPDESELVAAADHVQMEAAEVEAARAMARELDAAVADEGVGEDDLPTFDEVMAEGGDPEEGENWNTLEGGLWPTPKADDDEDLVPENVEALADRIDALEALVFAEEMRGPRLLCDLDDRLAYFKAHTDWANFPGNASHVMCHPCKNMMGDDPDENVSVGIYLPRFGSWQDPNIRSGAILAAILDGSNMWFAINPNLDGKVGKTIRIFNGIGADIPAGWQLCDGTNGTPNLTGRFVMGIDPDGLDDENEIGKTGGYRWHGMTENNHPNHLAHDHTHAAGTGFESGAAYKQRSTGPHTAEGEENDIVFRHGGIVNDWPVQNPVDEAHAHADTDNRPWYYVLAFIIRVD